MSAEEDLIDYSDDEIQQNDAAPAASAANGATSKKGGLTDAAKAVNQKASYVGVTSSGFRDFLLKNELVRAISDCGFEHPSEG